VRAEEHTVDLQLESRTGQVMEWGFEARDGAAAPHEAEADVIVSAESGTTWKVPAFWPGGSELRVRFRPPEPGRYTWEASGAADARGTLHAQGAAEPTRGPVIAAGQRFEHADGSPFLWLGDTWWMGLCARWSWPEDFQLLCADRQRKGFNVVQIVAGLYPDMPAFDERGANEAGFPWEKDWSRINPGWFNAADQRIQWMARCGIQPCLVGAWGYYLSWMGVAKMKRHWREVVARWSVYPVFWALAGEATMPYYLSQTPAEDRAAQLAGWTEIGRYVKEIDPWHRPVSLHTAYGKDSRDEVADSSLVDFDLIQCGNSGYFAQQETVKFVKAAVARTPSIPVVQAETCYENAQGTNTPDMVRFCWWSTWLSGVGGYTYGADGIWQASSRARPYGPSPTGMAWGDCAWEEAVNAVGSSQVAWGARLLSELGWERMAPHQEWIEPAADAERWFAPYAAGVPRKLRVIYYPVLTLYPWMWAKHVVKGLEPGVRYSAQLLDPRSGEAQELGIVQGDDKGEWRAPCPPVSHDWLVVLRAE
jgi:hypothetical protein